MRTRDTLFAIEDISIMLQYLYMNEDHKIVFNNGLADLEIRMDQELGVTCRNLAFPDVPAMDFSSTFTPAYALAVAGILKTMPAVEYPDAFANRWEEIKQIARTNMALNRAEK